MVTRGVFKFDKNTVLDENSIKELHDFLLSYCSAIKYEAKTKDGKSHEFESRDELLAYDNLKKEKIVVLQIIGEIEYRRVFVLDFYGTRHSQPYIECSYKFTDSDAETLFLTKITKFFEKRVECYNHHLVTSLTIAAAIFVSDIYLIIKNNMDSKGMWSLVFLSVMTYYLIENKMLKALFPPVVFCWGNEIKVHNTRTAIRNNLFWTVIIGIVLSKFFN